MASGQSWGYRQRRWVGPYTLCKCLMNNSLLVELSLGGAIWFKAETKMRPQNQEVTPMLIFRKSGVIIASFPKAIPGSLIKRVSVV